MARVTEALGARRLQLNAGAGARRLVEAAAVLEWPAPAAVLGSVAGLDDDTALPDF